MSPDTAVVVSARPRPVPSTEPVRDATVLWTRRRVGLAVCGFALGLGGMVAWKGVFLSPDRYFLILLIPAALLGIGRAYVRDMLPFVAAIYLYEHLRGLAHWFDGLIGWGPFYAPMIEADRVLFAGRIPPVALQDVLFSGDIRWYDHALMLVDRAHFIVPPTLLFVIWLTRRDLFYRCAAALVAVSLLGAATFLVFPAAPPWLAAEHGLIDPVVRIGVLQSAQSPVETAKSLIDSAVLPNPVAAVPSLHSAYSTLVFVFALAFNRRFGAVMALYPLTMFFTIVYVGDHYVIDIVVGVAYAFAAWLLVGRMLRPTGRLAALRGPFSPPLATARGGPR